ncbi:hypothetical protein [Methanoregula sp.]|jgi:hypothetical protein
MRRQIPPLGVITGGENIGGVRNTRIPQGMYYSRFMSAPVLQKSRIA